MAQRTVQVGSQHGLHARLAKLFVKAVEASGMPVRIAKGTGDPVSASSIFAVIALGIDHGDTVTLSCDHPESSDVLDSLSEVLVFDHDNA